MSYKSIIKKLKEKGIVFANGLTKEEFDKIENIYNIKFPNELRKFLSLGLPFSQHTSTPAVAGQPEYYHYTQPFPVWNDFSEDNIKQIKDWITAPKKMLEEEYEKSKGDEKDFNIFCNDLALDFDKDIKQIDKEFDYFLNNKLENTIPIYAHRYILQKEKSPILSIWESDDICIYGKNLEDYLQCEFFKKKVPTDCLHVDLGKWHNIVLR